MQNSSPQQSAQYNVITFLSGLCSQKPLPQDLCILLALMIHLPARKRFSLKRGISNLLAEKNYRQQRWRTSMCHGALTLIPAGNIDSSTWNFEAMSKRRFRSLRMCSSGVGIRLPTDCLKALNNSFVFGAIWDWLAGFSFLRFEGEELCSAMRGCSWRFKPEFMQIFTLPGEEVDMGEINSGDGTTWSSSLSVTELTSFWI